MQMIKRPSDIAASGTEHGAQVALFAYCRIAHYRGFDAADAFCETGVLPPLPEAHKPVLPALAWFHAIHNQGHGDVIRGSRAKTEGVVSGISDCFLPFPISREPTEINGQTYQVMYAGLYIEMKKLSQKPKRSTSKGGVSEDQAAFGKYAISVGYKFKVCYGWIEAVEAIKEYLTKK